MGTLNATAIHVLKTPRGTLFATVIHVLKTPQGNINCHRVPWILRHKQYILDFIGGWRTLYSYILFVSLDMIIMIASFNFYSYGMKQHITCC